MSSFSSSPPFILPWMLFIPICSLSILTRILPATNNGNDIIIFALGCHLKKANVLWLKIQKCSNMPMGLLWTQLNSMIMTKVLWLAIKFFSMDATGETTSISACWQFNRRDINTVANLERSANTSDGVCAPWHHGRIKSWSAADNMVPMEDSQIDIMHTLT